MREAPFGSNVASLLEEAREVGVVVDFVRFELTSEEADALRAHTSEPAYPHCHAAALEGMQVLARRNRERLARLGVSPREPAFRIQIRGEPHGRHVDYDTMLGPSWCTRTRRSRLNGRLRGAASVAEETAAMEGYLRWHHARGRDEDGLDPGLARAFLSPPYGLRASGDALWREREDLFARLLDELFYRLASPLLVHEWSDDWSNYFDPGREWWGTLYYTVGIADADELLVIGASSSD